MAAKRKLTDAQVRKIRELSAADDASHRQLADMYGVARSYVTLLVNGHTRVAAGGPVQVTERTSRVIDASELEDEPA